MLDLASELLGYDQDPVTLVGSLRRGCETVGDLDLICRPGCRDIVWERLLTGGCAVVHMGFLREELSLRVSWSPFPIEIDIWSPTRR